MMNQTENLSRQIATRLRNKIVSGDYQPGMFLPSERELQQEYQASRPIIRESLQILETQGLVASSARKGTIVNPNVNQPVLDALLLACVRSNVFLEDVLSVRLVLEPQIASIAASVASNAQIRDLLELTVQFETFDLEPDNSNMGAWGKLDTKFHLLVADATHNQVFSILTEVLHDILIGQHRTVLEASSTPKSLQLAAQHHRAIAEAIAIGDSRQASEAMRLHLETTIQGQQELNRERLSLDTI